MSDEPVRVVGMPVHLVYMVTAGRHHSRYLRALAKKQIIGVRCDECRRVYVPPRGSCPTCGLPSAEEVPVRDEGTITTFCVVNIPFGNMPFDPPYVAAAVLLDGADIPFFHLIRGVAPDEVRMGQRVRAVWVEDSALAPTAESIRWFEPRGEPDAPYDSYKEHL
jgi:uncharacterized OB-fold protein